MPGGNTIGIILELDSRGAIVSARSLDRSLDGVARKAGTAGKALGGVGRRTNDAQQGIMNMVMGLNELQRMFNSVGDAGQRALSALVDESIKFESAMTRVRITMGMTGDKVRDPALIREFEQVSSKIDQIGRDMNVNLDEAAQSFVRFKQAGFSATEIVDKRLADLAIGFKNASGNVLDLEEATNIVTGAMGSLGFTVDDIETGMDQLTRVAQNTRLSWEDFLPMFRSMGGAAIALKATTSEQFLAIAGMIKKMGGTAADAGQSFKSMDRALGFLWRKGGRAKRRIEALQRLGLSKKDLEGETGGIRALPEVIDIVSERLRKLRDENGILSAKIGSDLGRVFGVHAKDVFLKNIAFQDQYGKKLQEVAGIVKQTHGDTMNADIEWRKSTEGQLEILEGSWTRFMITMAELPKRAFASLLAPLTELLNVFVEWIREHPTAQKVVAGLLITVMALGKGMALLFQITAMIGFANMALARSSGQAAAGMSLQSTAAGILQRTMATLRLTMLPMLLVLAKFAAIAGVIYLAYRENLGGLKTFVDGWAKDLSDVFSILMPLLMGEGFDSEHWDQMSDRAKSIAIWISNAKDRFVEFWEGLKSGLAPMLEVAGTLISVMIKILTTLFNVVVSIIGIFTDVAGSVGSATGAFEGLGTIAGWLIGLWVNYKIVMMGVTIATKIAAVAQKLYTASLVVGRIAVAAQTVAMTALSLVARGFGAAFGIAITAIKAFGVALVTTPLGVVLLAIAAVIAAIGALVKYWDEVSEFFSRVGEAFEDFGNWLYDTFGEISDAVLGAFEWWYTLIWDIVSGIAEAIGSVFAGIAEFVWGIIEFIGSAIQSVAEIIGEIVSVLWDVFGDGLTAIGEFIYNFFASIGEFIWDFATTMYEAGANLIRSLWDGIVAVFEEVYSWFESAVGWLADLWPFSPAKRGPLRQRPPEQAGANYVGQIRDGMESAMPQIEEMAVEIAAKASDPEIARREVKATEGFRAAERAAEAPPLGVGVETDQVAAVGGITPQVMSVIELTTERVVERVLDSPKRREAGRYETLEGTPGGGGPAAASGGEARTITVNAKMSIGDLNLSPHQLSGEAAREFMRWIGSNFGEMLQKEFEARGMT